ELDARQNLLAVPRVLSHLRPLLVRELRGLAQDSVGHAYLPDVVKERAELKRPQLIFAEFEFAAQSKAEGDDALRVAVGLGVARLRAHARYHRKPAHALHRDVADDELEPARAEQRERLLG